jgi:acyl-CoA reductase-like NAD-dependent aldehyde dehydrogenase
LDADVCDRPVKDTFGCSRRWAGRAVATAVAAAADAAHSGAQMSTRERRRALRRAQQSYRYKLETL